MPVHNLEIFIHTFAKAFFKNLLEPKRMQVFLLKLQYQKVLRDFFKRKSVEASEFHLRSNCIVRSTL